jgi:hypothetical protein
MLKKFPKLSIVIPTRDRVDTLIHTLKTVTTQAYDNLEIIVSDNASKDSTKEVIIANKDKRIKYTNTGKRIGMSENWEHGLSLVTGDYVMFLGDDDGLLPNACCDVAELISKTNTKAIIWSKPDYTWPSVLKVPNILNLNCKYGLIEMRGGILLKEIAAGRTSYGRLPVIYSGFVSMESINEIRTLTNQFFKCVTPDVYSGIVLAQKFNAYLYSMRPFSINGGSQHSNGINQFKVGNRQAEKFLSENGLEIDKNFPLIPGTISSCVAEAFCQAKNNDLIGSNNLNIARYYKIIFNELMAQPLNIKLPGMRVLANLNLPKHLKIQVQKQLTAELNIGSSSMGGSNEHCGVLSLDDGVIRIDCTCFNINNSFDACQLVHNLLGKYIVPSNITRASYAAYALLAIRRKFNFIFKNNILPF